MRMPLRLLALSAVVAAVAGCGGGSGGSAPSASSGGGVATTSTSSETYVPKDVDAGVDVSATADTSLYKRLIAASARYGKRSDPFALTAEETAYDKQQNMYRVFNEIGGYTTQYQAPPEETKEVPPEEAQPYRRLAGIIVGDSVLAIIDMGDGNAATIIRPGMKIPNTEWTVVSINEDEAVLHRDGPIGPHTIHVRLETPPGGGQTFGGGGTTGPGTPPGVPGGGGKRQFRPGMGIG